MRVLKWMLDRIEGTADGASNVVRRDARATRTSTGPGSTSTAARYDAVTSIDRAAWSGELALHDELFRQLAHHLPAELPEVRRAHRRAARRLTAAAPRAGDEPARLGAAVARRRRRRRRSDLSDAEFAELDALLAAIPEPLEPLDVVMLDGFLCGVIVQPSCSTPTTGCRSSSMPAAIAGARPSRRPSSARARALILRRHAALNRAIAEFGSFDPFILEVDDRRRTTTPRREGAGDARSPARAARRHADPRRRSTRSARRSCPGSPASSRPSTSFPASPSSTTARSRRRWRACSASCPRRRAGRPPALVGARAAARFARRRDRRASSPASPSCTS